MAIVAKRLANHIARTVRGPMWHGPALGDLLGGVTADQAAARPIAGGHTIWEIVLHVAAWAEIARARLQGERLGDPSTAEDWPPVDSTDADAWTAAVDRLKHSYRQLAMAVQDFDDGALDAKVGELEYTVSNLLHGVIEHGTYHGGQIALLKRTFHS
jgi:uncharacterized damage-inducible protein DinB